MDCFCLQNLIAGLTLGFSSTTWKRISTWTLYLQRKSRLQIWRRKKFPNNFHRRAFGCQNLFSWTLKRSWTPKMTPRLLLWQGEMLFSGIGSISISRRNSSYTKSGHSVLDNIYIFEVTHKHVCCWTLSHDHREKATQSPWAGCMTFLGSVNMTCAGTPKIMVLICWLFFVF